MKIQRFGITFSTLQHKDLELVRQWRNADHVRPHMAYREYISADMQERWFTETDAEQNLYCIFSVGEQPIGLIQLKEIKHESGEAESGIFTGHSDFLNSTVPVTAILAWMDLAFDYFGMKALTAKVSEQYPKAIELNRSLGYQPTTQTAESGFSYYRVTREAYRTSTQRLLEALHRKAGNHTTIAFEDSDPQWVQRLDQLETESRVALGL